MRSQSWMQSIHFAILGIGLHLHIFPPGNVATVLQLLIAVDFWRCNPGWCTSATRRPKLSPKSSGISPHIQRRNSKRRNLLCFYSICRDHLGRRSPDKPAAVLEIGTYCGYSAITLLPCLRPNDKLIAIESDIECIRWTSQMLAKAGYRVKVLRSDGDATSAAKAEAVEKAEPDVLLLHGTAASCIQSGRLAAALGAKTMRVDVLFMDHDKAAYLPDLQALQKARLLAQTSLVVAGTTAPCVSVFVVVVCCCCCCCCCCCYCCLT